MDFGTIAACIVAVCTLLWTIYRDNSTDTNDLLDRMGSVETKIALQESSIIRLSNEQDEMKKSLKNLEDQIHQLDLKIERILTILENNKGA
ncbi:hypothetical protein ACP3S7_02870 [Phytobacter ursingii]